MCLKKGKFETIVKFLRTIFHEKVIIFVNTKKMAEELHKKLKDKEISSEFINGDLDLKERKKVIQNFKNQKNNILIATDVASRGLDIENVDYVINFDMPEVLESYIHRIGRTARAGKSGVSLSLINSQKQLEFLFENLKQYDLTELKVKRDDRLNQYVFVKTKTENFDFDNKNNNRIKTSKSLNEKIKENYNNLKKSSKSKYKKDNKKSGRNYLENKNNKSKNSFERGFKSKLKKTKKIKH